MLKKIGDKEIFKSKIFTIKNVNLDSSHGILTYQIIEKRDGAIIVPITHDGDLILVNEYFAGVDEYCISLPKGQIDEGHNALYTANKELQEEVGYKANKIIKLGFVTVSPGYLTQKISLFLALDLIPSKLLGDEVEELKVITYPFSKFEDLIHNGKISDARIIAALYLAKDALSRIR